jgi:uncharacterized surface protein with fasciclin (FAS1) repeats
MQPATRVLLATAAAAGVCVVLAACSLSAPTKASSGASAAPDSHVSVSAAQHIGTQCGAMPARGMGSYKGMAAVPVTTAVWHNPHLSDLAHVIQAAGLTSALNSAHNITVFAPDDRAFAALRKSGLARMMGSKAHLAGVVEYQVVPGQVRPGSFSAGRAFSTLEGRKVLAAKSGDSYKINQATIVCGNIRTANATVYITNRVMLP